MKPEPSIRFSHPRQARRFERGFALVITLSLMILLTVIAVGLLTLSGISLRASGQGSAMATARSNARMALMMALGELQKNAGPDQSVTARADVLDTTIDANKRLTGVWKSRDIEEALSATPSDFDKTERDKKFLGWLTSSIDGKASSQVDYTSTAPKNPATLWGKGSLGSTAQAADIVTAAKVPTTTSRGAFAWAVMDEGVKVRVNTTYQDGAATTGAKLAQLGTGERPGVEFIAGLNGLSRNFFKKGATQSASLEKGITRLNFSLAGEDIAGKTIPVTLKPLAHDITTFSAGLFTDTARGGLKQDFQLMANSNTLPSTYNGKGVYRSLLDMPASSAPSDPRWESLHEFSRLYRESSKLYIAGGGLRSSGPRHRKTGRRLPLPEIQQSRRSQRSTVLPLPDSSCCPRSPGSRCSSA